MSHTTSSIAGVRPQGLLARACVPSAVAWRGRCGAGANHGAGHGSALFSCASALGARPRVVQTESRQKLRTQAMSAAAHGPVLLAISEKRRRTDCKLPFPEKCTRYLQVTLLQVSLVRPQSSGAQGQRSCRGQSCRLKLNVCTRLCCRERDLTLFDRFHATPTRRCTAAYFTLFLAGNG